MPTVVIDPGHGGTTEIGGSSPNNATGPNGTLEKDLTLDVGLKCRDILSRQPNTSVLMTRDTDVNLGLRDRAHVARDNRADAFLSIHFNGDENSSIQGTETWVYTGTQTTAASYRLAELVQAETLQRTRYRDRGIRANNFGVLNPANHSLSTAACLVEISFITNEPDETRLADENYRLRLAEGLAIALYDCVTQRFQLLETRELISGKEGEAPTVDVDG